MGFDPLVERPGDPPVSKIRSIQGGSSCMGRVFSLFQEFFRPSFHASFGEH